MAKSFLMRKTSITYRAVSNKYTVSVFRYLYDSFFDGSFLDDVVRGELVLKALL